MLLHDFLPFCYVKGTNFCIWSLFFLTKKEVWDRVSAEITAITMFYFCLALHITAEEQKS
jgi:hypothetical protein